MKKNAAMTPAQAVKEIDKLASEISDKCVVSVYLGLSKYREKSLRATVGAQGHYPAETTFCVDAETFEELIEGIRSKWADHSAEYARKTTDNMALEIIRITDAFGECSDAALRADKFTVRDVVMFGAAACARAAEMASKGPFSITPIGGANGGAG